ncbi:MAG: hypothetical protein Q7S31_00615 [bacterium]|nr:hypothetical protein [bacterium]
MSFKYVWKNKEANFGTPIETEVSGGTHVSAECILKFNGKYIALRRPKAIPEHKIPEKAQKSNKPCLYDVHGLPRWGETTEGYVKRVIKDQAGVGVKSFRIADLTMGVYPDTQQWYIELTLFVEVDRLPVPGTYGNEVVEVVTFDKDTVPDDFGWWSKEQIEEFLKRYD